MPQQSYKATAVTCVHVLLEVLQTWVWADVIGQNAQIKENAVESIFTTHMVSDVVGKKYYTRNYLMRISTGHLFVFSYSRLLSCPRGLIFFRKMEKSNSHNGL